ncbi:MAG TPA: hypothetical protein VIH61_06780 [Waddliaceae bacterium]
MNSLNSDLNFYKSYFNGVNEIFDFNSSAKEVAWGMLKAVSVLTLVLPVIFGVGYLIAKSRIENATNLCNRVTKMIENQGITIEKVQNYQPAQVTQDDLVEFLVIKLQDERTEKIDHLRTVFKKLELPFQGKFFAAAAEKGKLVEAMKLIPKDAKELVFNIGEKLLFYGNFEKAYGITKTMMDELKNQINEFTELKKITIDLSGSSYYTEKVEWHINHYLIESYNNNKEKYPYEKFEMKGIEDFYERSGMLSPNNIDAVICTTLGLANCFYKNDKITIVTINFENLVFTAEKIEGNWHITELIGRLNAISWSGLVLGKAPPNIFLYPQENSKPS